MNTKLIEHAKKCAKCIYIAADKVVADDISQTINNLVAEIEYLENELNPQYEPLESVTPQEWWNIFLHKPFIWCTIVALGVEFFMRQIGIALFFTTIFVVLLYLGYKKHV